MANREPLIVRELLLTPLIVGIVGRKVIIEYFYTLYYVLCKELYKYSSIYNILGNTLL